MNAVPVIVSLILLVLLVFLLRSWRGHRARLRRYQPITDVERERDRVTVEVENAKTQLKSLQQQTHLVSERLETLKRCVGPMEDELALQEYGIYRPLFNYDDPEAYRETIKYLREQQRYLVKNNQAVLQHQEWVVDGKKGAGKQMMKKIAKLALQSFNGDCDYLISKVNASNWDKSLGCVDKFMRQLGAGCISFPLPAARTL